MTNTKKASGSRRASAKTSVKTKTKSNPKTQTSQNRSRASARSGHRLRPAQKVIIAVISIVVVVMLVFVIFALNFDAEHQVKFKISRLANDYYETYYYPNAFGDDASKAGGFLNQFSDSGLAPVTLRQLVLSLPDVSEDEKEFLRQYCDENFTTVRYFPTEPYASDSYRAEFNYSCNFE